MKRVEASSSNAAVRPCGLRLYVLNLSLLITLGLLLSGWMLYFTDSFPVVGGLLGLGGLFAWIAFLSGMLRNERKEEMQRGFEAFVLCRHGTWLAVLGILLIFLLWCASHGTILVDAAEDDLGRSIRITQADASSTPPLEDHLPPRQTQKYLIPTAWFGPKAYRVKVSGLPASVVNVLPLRRVELSVPGFFLSRPVVLLTLTPLLSGTVAEGRDSFDAVVSVVSGKEKVTERVENYRGESLWVGADSDVAIPPSVKDRWRLEMMKIDSSPETMRAFDVALIRWTRTLAAAPNRVLQPGDVVSARVMRRTDQAEIAKGEAAVRPLAGGRDFPQEIKLERP